MKAAFWDTSSLVLLLVQQGPSAFVQSLVAQYAIVVWWGTRVEVRSALERLRRLEQLTAPEHRWAESRALQLGRGWREVQPSEGLRTEAERLLASYPLRAADALQLAAALAWSSGAPEETTLIAGDAQLLRAAQELRFNVVSARVSAR